MPHCIAKGCMNRDNKCPKGVSFHRLPPKKPSLLHHVSFVHAFQLNTTCCDNIDRSFQWLLVLHLTDISINDANARVHVYVASTSPQRTIHSACYHVYMACACVGLYPRYVRCINKTVTSAVCVTQSPVTYSVFGIGRCIGSILFPIGNGRLCYANPSCRHHAYKGDV